MAPRLSSYVPTIWPRSLMPLATVPWTPIERGVGAAAQEKAVEAGGVQVWPGDPSRMIDAECSGAEGGRRSVERGVGAAAQEEAVGGAEDVVVDPDDLARGVDAGCVGAGGWIVERGVG